MDRSALDNSTQYSGLATEIAVVACSNKHVEFLMLEVSRLWTKTCDHLAITAEQARVLAMLA